MGGGGSKLRGRQAGGGRVQQRGTPQYLFWLSEDTLNPREAMFRIWCFSNTVFQRRELHAPTRSVRFRSVGVHGALHSLQHRLHMGFLPFF